VNQNCEITLEIGGMPILSRIQDPSFRDTLARRYVGFVSFPSPPKFGFDEDLTAPLADEPEQEDAIRRSMRNILFFAADPDLLQSVFQSACESVERVAVQQLTFLPDSRAWSMIQ
jgi:hypothetical protein